MRLVKRILLGVLKGVVNGRGWVMVEVDSC